MDSQFHSLLIFLCELDGVCGKTAKQLLDANYLLIEALKNAPQEELLNIKGIGKKLVEKLKS